ncbi:MAG: ThuA domain-containing protein, partial [Defluviitaleaceae bacterium]|nr:ThuA domain-containing protein [Defluviitaleaceae bacterium]
MRKLNVTVWNENEGRGEHDAYESGMNAAIVDFLNSSGEFGKLRAASLPQPEHGLSDEVLNDTDVLLWWGHSLHQLVSDGIVEKVRARILGGMGFIPLHSAHASKIFMKLMGTHTDRLRWRDAGERERVWKIAYGHPIAEGAPDYFDIPRSEMYGEHFHIPTPDELILV